MARNIYLKKANTARSLKIALLCHKWCFPTVFSHTLLPTSPVNCLSFIIIVVITSRKSVKEKILWHKEHSNRTKLPRCVRIQHKAALGRVLLIIDLVARKMKKTYVAICLMICCTVPSGETSEHAQRLQKGIFPICLGQMVSLNFSQN